MAEKVIALDENEWKNDEYIPNIEDFEKAVTLGEHVRFLYVVYILKLS